jgi:hypothetical protein
MSNPVILCAHVMLTGLTCGSPAARGSKFCFHHNPDRRERKPLRALAAGIEPLDSLSAIHHLINETVRLMLQGRIDSRRARTVIATARDAVSIHESQIKGLHILCGAAFDRINRTPDGPRSTSESMHRTSSVPPDTAPDRMNSNPGA